MQPAETILIVDDDDVLRQRLEKSLTRRGWTIFAAEGFETAIALAETHQPTRAVLDLKMPGQSGLDVLQKIREISPNTKCVILTGLWQHYATPLKRLNLAPLATSPNPPMPTKYWPHSRNHEKLRLPTSPPPSLAEAQWEHIQRVLADSGGNISEAARRLDIPSSNASAETEKKCPLS